MATEDYLRSRRIFKTTSAGNTHDEDSMEVDAVSRKGTKKNPARARRVARKEKKATQAKVTEKRQQNTHDSMVNVETCGKYGHTTSDCWYKQMNKSQGKGKGTGKSKSKVTEISESYSSKQVDDWCPSPNTSAQQPNLSQVNAIGCADEGLWIFSMEDSKKRRYT